MPIGGADGIGHDESVPGDTESVALGDDRIRSVKTSLRQVLDSEHNYPSAGGNAVGYHRFGSARPYYGPQSAVSSSGSDGRVMLTSDTSRYFAVGSGGTSLIGGPTVISAGSFPGGLPQRHAWVEEFGMSATTSKGTIAVTFPNSGYSGAPYVFITPTAAGAGSSAFSILFAPTACAVTATSFVATMLDSTGNYCQSSFFWRSIGSRVL